MHLNQIRTAFGCLLLASVSIHCGDSSDNDSAVDADTDVVADVVADTLADTLADVSDDSGLDAGSDAPFDSGGDVGDDGDTSIPDTPDAEPPPPPVTVDSPSVIEDAASVTFTVTLAEEHSETLEFSYSTADDTAISGEDYESASGTVVVSAGETIVTISVDLLGDDTYECDEAFALNLSGSLGEFSGTGTIVNDTDPGPVLTLDVTEGEVRENVGTVDIGVSLASASCKDAVIEVSYGHITTDSDDITELSFTVPAGDLSAVFALPVTNDDLREVRERLELSLSSTDEVTVTDQTYALDIVPVIERIFEGETGLCAHSQDNLVTCWGYGNTHNFANGIPDTLGDTYGEAGSTEPNYYCNRDVLDHLVEVTTLEAGDDPDPDTCPEFGGLRIENGLDDNSDGTLEPAEVDDARSLCSVAGRSSLVSQGTEPAGDNCADGGVRLYNGTDYNGNGTLDLDQMGENLIPSDIGDERVLDLGLGEYFTCALFESQRVKCWGENSNGYLALGDSDEDFLGDDPDELGNDMPFVNLGDGVTVIDLAVGYNYTCAVLNTGEVKCWGANHSGRLGTGDIENRGDTADSVGDNLLPVDLGRDDSGEPYTAIQISAGYWHSCAVLNDGQIKCWGRNANGQLGLGDTDDRGAEPGEMGDALPTVDLGEGVEAVDVYCGYRNTCALLSDGGIKCWGENGYGELGLGDDENVGDGGEDSWVRCARSHEILWEVEAVEPAPEPACEFGGTFYTVWEDSNDNGIHDSDEFATQDTVCHDETVNRIVNFTEVGSDNDYCGPAYPYGLRWVVGLDRDGDDNIDSEMGDNLPELDLGLGVTVESLNMGWYHTCLVLSDGSSPCFGYGGYGNLGLDDDENWGDEPSQTVAAAESPRVGTGRSVVQFGGQGYTTCGLLDNGEIKCWGYSDYGEGGVQEHYELSIGDGQDEDGEPSTEMGDALPAVRVY